MKMSRKNITIISTILIPAGAYAVRALKQLHRKRSVK